MTNHGCRFTWCTNELGTQRIHQLEHYAAINRIPATGSCLVGRDDIELPMVGISTHFDEDLEPSANISLTISGGRPHAEVEVDLRPDEAVLLYNALGTAIRNAIEGSNFDPERVTKFYSTDKE